MTKAAVWAKRIAEWRESGLGAAEFCMGREYSAKTLWYWSSKLGRASREAQPSRSAVQLVRMDARSAVAMARAHANPANQREKGRDDGRIPQTSAAL